MGLVYNNFYFDRFVAVSETGDVYLPYGTIKFDREDSDKEGNFDPSTGIFEASEEGTYIFSFNAFVNHRSTSAKIHVYLNGDIVEYIYSNAADVSSSRQLTGFWPMKLTVGDTVWLSNYFSGSIYIDNTSGMYWMGYRLN